MCSAPCAPSLSRNLRVPSLSRLQMRAVQANRGMASSVQGLYMAELAKIAARKEDGVRSFSFSRAGCRSRAGAGAGPGGKLASRRPRRGAGQGVRGRARSRWDLAEPGRRSRP